MSLARSYLTNIPEQKKIAHFQRFIFLTGISLGSIIGIGGRTTL